MLAIINKHLKSGDQHLAEAKHVVDCNADVIPSGSRANFARKLDGYATRPCPSHPPFADTYLS